MRRSLIIVIAVIALVAVFLLMRGRDNGPDSQPPVLGSREPDTTGFYEEISVFEYDTAGDVVTITDDMTATPDSEPTASAPTKRPAAAAPSQPTREEVLQRRQRAIAEMPRYQSEMTQQPRNALAINNYAWSLHLAGKYQEAEHYLREVISIAPDRAIAYANLGETLWKLGRNEEAAAMYRKFLAMNTDPRREKIAEGKIAQITR